jgi:hypothetical protein
VDNSQRVKPFSLGMGFFVISLVLALLLPHTHEIEGASAIAWFEQATLWLGVICVAGHLFSLLLRYRDRDRDRDRRA